MVMKALFGSKKEEVKQPPQPKLDFRDKEKVKEVEREYTRTLQKEMREIERQIIHNDLAEKKCRQELKKAIKDKQDKSILRIYAQQVAQCTKMKQRMLTNKAKIQGLIFSIQTMFANMRMTQVLSGTTDVMKQIGNLMNIKDMNKTMQELQKSMMQFGLINEMVEDAMEQMDGDDNVDMNENELDEIIASVEQPTGTKVKANIIVQDNKDDDLAELENRLGKLN